MYKHYATADADLSHSNIRKRCWVHGSIACTPIPSPGLESCQTAHTMLMESSTENSPSPDPSVEPP